MRNKKIQQDLDTLPNAGTETEDVAHSMRDEAEFARTWLHDCIVRQQARIKGDSRFDSETMTLMKVKSYDVYIRFSQAIRDDMEAKADELLSSLKNKE